MRLMCKKKWINRIKEPLESSGEILYKGVKALNYSWTRVFSS